jgi:hypothetical protein
VLIENISSPRLMGDHPRIEFAPPKINDKGGWLVSGKLIVEFTQGPFVPPDRDYFDPGKGLAIAVPFSDAESESGAILQAVAQLQQISREIDDIASDLQQFAEEEARKGQHIQK